MPIIPFAFSQRPPIRTFATQRHRRDQEWKDRMVLFALTMLGESDTPLCLTTLEKIAAEAAPLGVGRASIKARLDTLQVGGHIRFAGGPVVS